MTTNEIRDLVSRKIEGQGNQIDLGGGLPEIINALCDLVDAGRKGITVEGTLDPDDATSFIPAEGSPSWQECHDAFISGTPVFLKFAPDDETDPTTYLVTSDSEGAALYVRDGARYVEWLR